MEIGRQLETDVKRGAEQLKVPTCNVESKSLRRVLAHGDRNNS